MTKLAVLNSLLETATAAVSLKRQLLKREMELTVCKDVHLKQFESVEKELIKALKPVFALQVKEAMAEPGKVLNKAKWKKRILRAVAPALIRGSAEAAKSQLLLMGVRRKSFELWEKFNPHHDHLGRFATGGGVGAMPSVLLPPKVDENILSDFGLTGMLAGSDFRKKVLLDNGADEDGIAQMDQLFDWHRWGGDSQIQADQKIADEIGKDTPLGKTLRVQVAVETALLDRYEELKGKRIDAQEEQSKKDMKEAWEFGWGPKNSDAYDSWEEQWKVEQAGRFRRAREPLKFYRKGGADKDVLPTSLRSTGAQSHSVTGAAQPHFDPDHSWSAKELKDAGYGVLGGFGYIQMGYSGESEITWVKLPSTKSFKSLKFNPHHDHLGRFATGGSGGFGNGPVLGIGDPVGTTEKEVIEYARNTVLGFNDDAEHLIALDSTGRVIGISHGDPGAEAVDSVRIPELRQRGSMISEHHNHPFDSPPSLGDILHLADNEGISEIFAHSKEASYRVRPVGEDRRVLYFAAKDVHADVRSRLLDEFMDAGKLDPAHRQEFYQQIGFAFMKELSDKGLIEYSVERKQDQKYSFFKTKASTATEYLLSQGLELPNNFLTEFPKVMQDRIIGFLTESFDQDYWEEMTQTTQDDIERVIKAGVNSGVSIADLARQIDTLLGEDAYYHRRAENIARTEAGNALNGARKVAMEETLDGLPPELGARPTWLSVLGNTTRDSHADLDGVPAGKDGMWSLDGYRIPWPGHISLPPGSRCFCRCTIVVSWGMDEGEARRLIANHYDRIVAAERSFTLEIWEKFNPHHDHLGRFARGSGGGSFGDALDFNSLPKEAQHEISTLSWDSINPALRDGSWQSNDLYRRWVDKADELFEKYARVLDEPVQTYRGVSKVVYPTTVGESFTEPGYLRLSKDASEAESFSAIRGTSGQVLNLTLPSGSRALPGDHIREGELYLPRGASFKVTGVTRQENGRDAFGNFHYIDKIDAELVLSSTKGFELWEKFNPHHDHLGRFARGSGGSFVSREAAEEWSKGSAITTPLFRATNHPDTFPKESTGGYAAISDGVYFGEDKKAIEGYGSSVVEFRAKVDKVLTVNGDKELDPLKKQAKQWGDRKVQSLILDFQRTGKMDSVAIAELVSSSSQLRLFLEDQGYGALRYVKTDPVNDHHDQIVVFRVSSLVAVNNEKNFTPQIKFNPHHDHLGRFATGGGVGGMSPDTGGGSGGSSEPGNTRGKKLNRAPEKLLSGLKLPPGHPEALQLFDSFSSKMNPEHHGHSEIQAALAAGQGESVVVLRDWANKERVVAAISFSFDDMQSKDLIISHLGSTGDVKGAGTEAMRYAVDRAHTRGVGIRFESTPNAVGFYESLGFQHYDPTQSKLMALDAEGVKKLKQQLGSAGRTTKKSFDEKFNPYHDHLGRFARARGSGMAETEVHDAKTLGGANGLKILESKELGGGINKSLLVDYVDKDGITRKAVFKPTNGAMGRAGFEAETIAAREVAASVIDQEMGLGMVGKVEHANLEGHGAGSLHEWVNTGATPAISIYTAAEVEVGTTGKTQAEFDNEVNSKVISQFDKISNIRDMQYFDAMIGNVDRHLGNWLIKDGQAKLIDHGYSLASNNNYIKNPFDRFRTMETIPKYKAPSPMSSKFKEGLNKILTNKEQVDAKLKKAGLPDEDRESFWKRAEYLTKVPMLGFGPGLLTELASNSEGVAPWDM